MPLSRQELRDALIPGQARRILKEWADSEAFKAATGYSVCSDRRADREMVLRFVAFRLIDPFAYAEDDFDSFLRASMQLLNELPKVEVDELWEEFERAMETAHEIFGDYAFRTMERDGGGRRLPINEALFEAVCVNLVMMPDDDIATLGERREQVQELFLDLVSDVDFQAAISPGVDEPAKVRLRFHAIRAMFWSVVGVQL